KFDSSFQYQFSNKIGIPVTREFNFVEFLPFVFLLVNFWLIRNYFILLIYSLVFWIITKIRIIDIIEQRIWWAKFQTNIPLRSSHWENWVNISIITAQRNGIG